MYGKKLFQHYSYSTKMMAMIINEITQSTVHVLTELDPGKS